jgi:hypothetical protein
MTSVGFYATFCILNQQLPYTSQKSTAFRPDLSPIIQNKRFGYICYMSKSAPILVISFICLLISCKSHEQKLWSESQIFSKRDLSFKHLEAEVNESYNIQGGFFSIAFDLTEEVNINIWEYPKGTKLESKVFAQILYDQQEAMMNSEGTDFYQLDPMETITAQISGKMVSGQRVKYKEKQDGVWKSYLADHYKVKVDSSHLFVLAYIENPNKSNFSLFKMFLADLQYKESIDI